MENPNGEDKSLTGNYGKLTHLYAPYTLDFMLKIKMIIFLICYACRGFMQIVRRTVYDEEKEKLVKWKLYASNIHYVLEFMSFNSSLISASFPGIIMYQFKIYNVRMIPILDLALVLVYLIVATFYLIEMVFISTSKRYSTVLNNLSICIYTNFKKFDKKLKNDSKFKNLMLEEFKIYGAYLNTGIKPGEKKDDLNESKISLNAEKNSMKSIAKVFPKVRRRGSKRRSTIQSQSN